MSKNDTISPQNELFPADEPRSRPTARTAIKSMVRTLARTKSWKQHAVIERAKQRENNESFFRAFDFFRSECCDTCNENDSLLHDEKGDTAPDPPVSHQEQDE